ncbi:hypothetical protein RJD24_19760 [Bacillaceae bacterium IKA-2]|nr:hypothetical protein RJD24_19760 [Bacillaceae bacterium IKA-2]
MIKELTQQKLLSILQEARYLGENNENISSKDLVNEIKKMLLFKGNLNSL